MEGTYRLRQGQTAALLRPVQAFVASGDLILTHGGIITLAHATVVIAIVLPTARPGMEYVIMNNSASGTAAHTVTAASGDTFDGTNDIATFNAPEEALHIVCVEAGRWLILNNLNSVGLSSS